MRRAYHGRKCEHDTKEEAGKIQIKAHHDIPQRAEAGLIKDPLIYGADSLMLDLEDAVAENQKDAARFSLYQALKTVDYGDTEVIVRINGLDTPHWREDVRVCVAAGRTACA